MVNIWRYDGGYEAIGKATDGISKMPAYNQMRLERSKFLNKRTNQLLVQFEHMPDPFPRSGNKIYEIRSYKLKAGTIGEWHHNWAHIGLKCRDSREVVTGLFTNAGPL
jgi:hypothetical protein